MNVTSLFPDNDNGTGLTRADREALERVPVALREDARELVVWYRGNQGTLRAFIARALVMAKTRSAAFPALHVCFEMRSPEKGEVPMKMGNAAASLCGRLAALREPALRNAFAGGRPAPAADALIAAGWGGGAGPSLTQTTLL